MVIFKEFLAFDKELNKIAQTLDEAVAHLLPPPPDQQQTWPVTPQHVPPHRGIQKPLPQGCYKTLKSEPDSDDEMDPNLPWRDVQDVPFFLLMNIMRNARHQLDPIEYNILDIENSLYLSLQNTPPPPNDSNNNAGNEL